MDQYKISQNPGSGKKKKPASIKARAARKAPKRKSSRSLDPQMILATVTGALVLILGGLAWAHYLNKSAATTASSSSATQTAGRAGKGATAKPTVSTATFTAVTTAVGTKNPASLGKYYASHVHVIIRKTGFNKTLSAAQVSAIITDPLTSAETPWNWHVPPGDLAAWQNGPDGQYFTGNVIVGISNDGTVISIGFDDNGNITTIFIAPEGDLTTSAGDSGTPGSTTTGGGTTDSGSSGNPTTPGSSSDSD